MTDKEIVVHTDKRGKDHIDIYSGDPKSEHTSIHINWDSSTGSGKITDTTSGTKETTDTQCYLTTACMRYRMGNFDDNCRELKLLRWFRDRFVSEEDITHYYEVAPIVVESINERENSSQIFNGIYENVIIPCVEAICNSDYQFAYDRYKSATLDLEREYARPFLGKKLVKALNQNNNM